MCSNSASACLLLALLLTINISFGNGGLTNWVKISRDENTTYPETTIPQGKVRGINMLTYYNRTISGFLGIPYAQPPIGDLRFKAPVPSDAWNGTLDASTEAEACPQLNRLDQISGDEDCLYLNVFTPHVISEIDNLIARVTNTSELLVNCLREFNVSRLLDTASIFHVWKRMPYNVWRPTSEPDIEGALLVDTPANLLNTGNIRDLPWISTLVAQGEGFVGTASFYEDENLFDDFLDDIDLALPIIAGYDSIADDVTAYTTALMAYYLNDLTANRSILLKNLTDLIGDALFVYPTYKSLQQQLVLAKNPQYFCAFDYRGTFSYTYYYSGGSTKYTSTAHAEEIVYLFRSHDSSFGPPDAKFNENDLIMVDTMVQLWTSFAANGTPTMVDSDKSDIWEPYSSLNNYLQIGNGSGTALEMKYDLFIERMRFWEEFTAATSGSGFKNPLQALSIVLCLYLLSSTS